MLNSPSPEQVAATAAVLPEPHRFDFSRLVKTTIHGSPFQWILAETPIAQEHGDPVDLPRRLLNQILSDCYGPTPATLVLDDSVADVPALEAALFANSAQSFTEGLVQHVIVQPGWFNSARWDAFNVRRERIAQTKSRIIFWIDYDSINDASLYAPDFYAWRSGIYSFLGDGLSPSIEAAPVSQTPPTTIPPCPEKPSEQGKKNAMKG